MRSSASVSAVALLIALAGCAGSPAVPQISTAQTEMTRPAMQSATAGSVTKWSSFFLLTNNDTIKKYNSQGSAEQTGPFAGLANADQMLYDPNNQWIYFLENASSIGGTPTIVAYSLAGIQQTLSGGFANLPAGSDVMMFDAQNGFIYVGNGSTSGPPVVAYNNTGKQETLSGGFAGISAVTGLAYDSHVNQVYAVSATSSPMVQAFTSAGTAVTLTGTWATVTDPQTIAYDSALDHLYVLNLVTTHDFVHILAYDEQGNRVTLKPGFTPDYQFTEAEFNPVTNQFFTMRAPNGLIDVWDSQGNGITVTGPFSGTGTRNAFAVAYQL